MWFHDVSFGFLTKMPFVSFYMSRVRVQGIISANRLAWLTSSCLLLIEVIYFTVLLVRFEDTLIAPPTQRVARDISVVRLPRLYFCPANRYKQARLIWNSYECSFDWKSELARVLLLFFSSEDAGGIHIKYGWFVLGEWGVIFRDIVGCGLWTAVGRLTCSLERCRPIDKIYWSCT